MDSLLRWLRGSLWYACLGTAIAVALYPLAIGKGVPAFQQDWAWPMLRAQCIPLTTAGFEPWQAAGLGLPAAYPESFIYHAFVGDACVAFGPKYGLIFSLVVALTLAALGYRALYAAVTQREALSNSAAACVATSLFAVANPVVLNKMQAGHLKFLLGYAILPWVGIAAMRLGRTGAAWALGTLLGIAALDPQFMAFGALAAIAFFWYGGCRAWPRLIVAIGIAIGINLQQIVPALLPAAGNYLNVQSPVLFWQRSQSGSIAHALLLTGYIGGYAHRLLPRWLQTMYWLVPATAVLLPLIRARQRLLALAFLSLAGIFIVTGWNSPLAPAWTFGFSHIHALAVFRELYNATVLIIIAFAAGLGIGLGLLLQRRPGAAYSLCACLAALSFGIAMNITRDIPMYAPTPAEFTAASAIAHEHGSWRFATVPGSSPMTDPSHPQNGGYSPWALPMAGHGAFFSSTPNDVGLYTNALLRQESLPVETWLTRDDIGLVKFLAGWRTRSVAQAEPSMKQAELRYLHDFTIHSGAVIRDPHAQLVAVEPFSAGPGGLDSAYRGARNLSVFRGGHAVVLQNFLSDVSPATGWGRTSLLPVLPAWAYTQPTALFTLRNSAVLRIPAAWVIAGDNSGRIASNDCLRMRDLGSHFKVFNCHRNPRFSGQAPIVISQAVTGTTIAPPTAQQGSYGAAKIVSARLWRIQALVHATPRSAVVLRESFSKGWMSSLPGARHVMVDGYANAWIPTGTVNGIVTFTYAPALIFFLSLAISFAMLLISGTMIVLTRARTRTAMSGRV